MPKENEPSIDRPELSTIVTSIVVLYDNTSYVIQYHHTTVPGTMLLTGGTLTRSTLLLQQ